jgi:histone H3/H4
MSNTLPLASVERIIKEAGIPRVSSDATRVIIEHAINEIKKVATTSYALTQHAGRNTLKDIDVNAALSL